MLNIIVRNAEFGATETSAGLCLPLIGQKLRIFFNNVLDVTHPALDHYRERNYMRGPDARTCRHQGEICKSCNLVNPKDDLMRRPKPRTGLPQAQSWKNLRFQNCTEAENELPCECQKCQPQIKNKTQHSLFQYSAKHPDLHNTQKTAPVREPDT